MSWSWLESHGSKASAHSDPRLDSGNAPRMGRRACLGSSFMSREAMQDSKMSRLASSATGDSSRRASDCRKVRQNRPSVVAGLPLAPTRNVQRSIGKTSRGDLIDETAVNDQQCHPHASGPVRVGVPRAVPGARRSHHAHHTRGRGADPLWRVRRNRRDLPLEAGGSRMWIGPGIGRGVARRRRTRWEPLRHAHGLIPRAPLTPSVCRSTGPRQPARTVATCSPSPSGWR